MAKHDKRTVRQACTDFEYALVELLSSPQRRVAKQLERKVPMATVRTFIERRHPFELSNPLRRFLSGEFTDGVMPVVIPDLHHRDVERILGVLDVVCAIAELKDMDPKRFSLTKVVVPPVEEIIGEGEEQGEERSYADVDMPDVPDPDGVIENPEVTAPISTEGASPKEMILDDVDPDYVPAADPVVPKPDDFPDKRYDKVETLSDDGEVVETMAPREWDDAPGKRGGLEVAKKPKRKPVKKSKKKR
jgi:hypothetical protein